MTDTSQSEARGVPRTLPNEKRRGERFWALRERQAEPGAYSQTASVPEFFEQESGVRSPQGFLYVKRMETKMGEMNREEVDAKLDAIEARLTNKVDKMEHTVSTFIEGVKEFKTDIRNDLKESKKEASKNKWQIIIAMVSIAIAASALFLSVGQREGEAFDRGFNLGIRFQEPQAPIDETQAGEEEPNS